MANLFTAELLARGFDPWWLTDPHTIEKASFFTSTRRPEETQNKVVVGFLINFCFPRSSQAFGFRLNSSVPGKGQNNRQKLFSTNNYEMIMIFADIYDLPNCFAIIFQHRRDFQRMFENNALSEKVTVGDALVFLEPQPHDEKLGDNMTVLKSPELSASLRTSINWPTQDPLVAPEGDCQVAFHCVGKTINIARTKLLTGRDKITCANITCDRQNINCTGCFGRSPTQNPIVLQCDVTIPDCPAYDPATSCAIFWSFRSLRFSQLFFGSLDQLSSRSPEVIRQLRNVIRQQVHAMIEHVNNHGGWTLIGWHRRGVHRVQNDEILVSNKTLGHLVYVMPTNEDAIAMPAFVKNKINLPAPNNPVIARGDNANNPL